MTPFLPQAIFIAIIEDVFEQPHENWLKVLLIAAGFGLMALIGIRA